MRLAITSDFDDLKGLDGDVFEGERSWRFECHDVLDSTMNAAWRAIESGVGDGLVVLAAHQTLGRGRIGRNWSSKRGESLLCSLTTMPAAEALPWMMVVGGLAVAEGIEIVAGLSTQMKWPNDVLVRGGKVAGILAESRASGGRTEGCVVGFGINLSHSPDDVDAWAVRATSLSAEGADVSAATLARAVVERFDVHYDRLQRGVIPKDGWLVRLATLGQQVVVQSAGKADIVGLAMDVDDEARLMVRTDSGKVIACDSGDVRVRLSSI